MSNWIRRVLNSRIYTLRAIAFECKILPVEQDLTTSIKRTSNLTYSNMWSDLDRCSSHIAPMFGDILFEQITITQDLIMVVQSFLVHAFTSCRDSSPFERTQPRKNAMSLIRF